MQLKLSVSSHGYKSKEQVEKNNGFSKIRFTRRQIGLSEFEELIKQGYGFCNWFKTQGGEFPISKKRDANFDCANVVFVDVDDYTMEMNELVSRLEKKPTLYYTTWSNNPPYYRFRLCYVFEGDVTDINTFGALYWGIISSIRQDVPDYPNKDKCGAEASHLMLGNGNGKCEVVSTGRTYRLTEFEVDVAAYIASKDKNKKSHSGRSKRYADISQLVTDTEFMEDMKRMPPIRFIGKYWKKYPFMEYTQLDFNDGYAKIPKNFVEILRCWTYNSVLGRCQVRRIADGEGRRFKMFLSAQLHRLIKPDITFEHLLFNLFYERQFYYENFDGVLTDELLQEKAAMVVTMPFEDIFVKVRNKHKTFMVDKEYCRERGIKPRTMSNMVRKKLKDEEIAKWYNEELSVSENLALMKENGVKIGRSRLYAYCDSHGIPRRSYRRKSTQW